MCVFDCPEDDDEFVDNVTPTDRRFWLLTVIGGLYGPGDHPALENKLARLYRIAFTRQQALHLGISNSTIFESSMRNRDKRELRYRRRRRRRSADVQINPTKTLQSPPSPPIKSDFAHPSSTAYERYKRRRKKVHKRDAQSNEEIISNHSQILDGNRKIFERDAYTPNSRRKVRVVIHNTTHVTDNESDSDASDTQHAGIEYVYRFIV